MIVSVRDKRLVEIAAGRVPKRFPADLVLVVERRIKALMYADKLMDLTTVAGHRLEPLRGDRAGQHSIRVNAQWRICFRWEADGAHDVEMVDYH
jgi:toxin HigB-1